MELPHLGQKCIVCNRDDYLPFKCEACQKVTCVEHRYSDHGEDCQLNRSHFAADQNESCYSDTQKKCCDQLNCKNISCVECEKCQRNHCIHHRHEHDCPKLKEPSAYKNEAEERSIRQKIALDKLRDSIKANQVKQKTFVKPPITDDPKKLELAKRIRLMKIKQSARGPPNILQDDKLYFEVKFKHEPQSPLSDANKHDKIIKIFTSPKHTIGRMIDWSSDELGVTNKNHIIGVSQLVFKKQNKSDELVRLDSQYTFSHFLSNGSLENGDEIILTYETI